MLTVADWGVKFAENLPGAKKNMRRCGVVLNLTNNADRRDNVYHRLEVQIATL